MSKAEMKAEKLVRELGIKVPPVDVTDVAKRLGIQVKQADFGDDLSGVLVRKDGVAIIGVHWAHAKNRQRFTIAHELGHHVLGHKHDSYLDKGFSVQFRESESGSGTPAEEREANQFAAALLMPRRWVLREFRQRPFELGDDSALAELSSMFHVSTQAMMWRLTNLGAVLGR
jgi:Zn-dependent peptidase ImmA (M78 family)